MPDGAVRRAPGPCGPRGFGAGHRRGAARPWFQARPRGWNLIGSLGFYFYLSPTPSGVFMIRCLSGIATVAAACALPIVAHAQGVPGGVERGSREGERA